ncbi:MAG: HEAT repeat domain-containing protein [Planctomycetota bacterium]|nr:MAG: HEAT repeat domain-containing protein [Planctomycetota bacterium]
MRAGFYPWRTTVPAVLLLLLAVSCGGGGPAEEGGGAEAQAAVLRTTYQPPADGDLLPRMLGHLSGSSRESLHFALEELPSFGDRAAEALAAGVAERLPDPARFAELHNYCKGIAACGRRQDAELMLRVLRESPVPLVRSAAAEALGRIGGPEHSAALCRILELESEPGPLQAEYAALGRLGGPAAAAFLEERIRAWAAGRPGTTEDGNLAWGQVLELDDPDAPARLAELTELLPGRIFHATALRRRAELGDLSAVPELRTMLDPAAVPAASTRTLVVEGLGFAGDAEGVVAALDDPDPKVVLAAVNALSLAPFREARVAHDRLEELARGEDRDLARAAMQALSLRGDRRLLEPWLLRARGYPNEPFSVEAIDLLQQEELRDERTFPVLLQAWAQSGTEPRIGLLRVFGRLKDPRSLSIFEELVFGPDSDPDLHRMAITQLANLGEVGEPLLLRLGRGSLSEQDAEPALTSLAARARQGDAEARELLIQISRDPERPPWVREAALPLLVPTLRLDAFPLLLELRDLARSAEERLAVEDILNEFF